MRSKKKRLASITLGVLATSLVVSSVTTPAAATTAPSPATLVEKITGPHSPNDTPGRFNVGGTDLGITWDNNAGQILTIFGDTYDRTKTDLGGGGPGWRNNVLFRSTDNNLTDGMRFVNAVEAPAGNAAEVIHKTGAPNGWPEVTVIPTAAIAVGSRQYVSYMSVRSWGAPGEWVTNFARIAYSDNNGATWNYTNTPQWTNDAADTNRFQMQAMTRSGGYVYVFGTPSGRNGNAYLARVPEAQVLTKSAYSYWNGSNWALNNEAAAVAVVGGPVAELSVKYDSYSHKWLMMYLLNGDLILKTATSLTGPWSAPQIAVSSSDYPTNYGGYIHPWSSSGNIYFTMSQWDPYNVYLMRLRINTSGVIINPNIVGDPSFERTVLSSGSTTGGNVGATWRCSSTNCGLDGRNWTVSGNKNAYVRSTTGWNSVYQTVAVQPYVNYQLTGWLRTSSNSNDGFFGVRTPGQVVAETKYYALPGWTRLVVNFNSGNRTSLEVFAGIWSTADMWMQVDDVTLARN
jgi:hypothetical protein